MVPGGMSLVKTGTGTQTLSGTNTYTGSTTMSGGTLQARINPGLLPHISALDVSGAFNLNGNSKTIGSLGRWRYWRQRTLGAGNLNDWQR